MVKSHHLQMNIVQSSSPVMLQKNLITVGISWGANHGSFSLNTSGPGGTRCNEFYYNNTPLAVRR